MGKQIRIFVEYSDSITHYCRYQGMIKGYSGVFRLGEATSTWDADSSVRIFFSNNCPFLLNYVHLSSSFSIFLNT